MSRQSIHRASFRAQLRLNGEDGVYITTDGEEFPLRAVRGQTPFRQQSDGNGGARITRSTDWLFDHDELLSDVGRPPKDGDKFRVTIDVGTRTITTEYRVTPFNNEPVYRTEPTLSFIRAHTQEFATL